MRLHFRASRSLVVAAFIALGLPTAAAAQESEDCTVSVEPGRGRTGTTFVISGSGYQPAQLVLQKAGEEPVAVPLELPPAEGFEIPVQSAPGDEGRWTATVTDPATGCSASTQFVVTLLDTATAQPARPVGAGGMLPLQAYLLAVLIGLVGGLGLARWRRTA